MTGLLKVSVFTILFAIVTFGQSHAQPKVPTTTATETKGANLTRQNGNTPIESQNQHLPNKNIIDPLSGVSFVVGVAGLFIGYISWQSSKRKEKLNDYLFQVAEKNLRKDIAEEELLQRQKEVEEASQKISTLQKIIEDVIPMEARRAVLRDKLNHHMELLTQSHIAVSSISQELQKIDEQVTLPKELMAAITDQISPEYILRERRSSIKTQITILTTTAALGSSLLPYPIGQWVSWSALALAVPVLLRLVRASIKGDPEIRRRKFLVGVGLFLLLTSILSLFMGVIFIFGCIYSNWPNDRTFFIGAAVVSFLMSIVFCTASASLIRRTMGQFTFGHLWSEARQFFSSDAV